MQHDVIFTCLILLLAQSSSLLAEVQAGPMTSSDNTELLKQILQVVQEQGEQIKHLGVEVKDLKTEENYLLSVLTGQQTQLASKIDKVEKNQEQLRTDIDALDAKLTKSTDKLVCEIAQHNLDTITLNGRKYFFSYSQPLMTWNDAQTFCVSHHMDLVSVETQEEWKALLPEVEKLENKLNSPWSSATDSAQEGKWTWGNGRDVTFHNRQNTKNRDNEDCMYLNTEWWGDAPCSYKRSFICQINSLC